MPWASRQAARAVGVYKVKDREQGLGSQVPLHLSEPQGGSGSPPSSSSF